MKSNRGPFAALKRRQTTAELPLLQSITLGVLLVAVAIHLLILAKDVMIPVLFGFYLSALLFLPMRFLQKIYLPQAVAALVLVAAIVAALLGGFSVIKGSAENWIESLPQMVYKIRSHTESIQEAVEEVTEKTTQVESAVTEVMESGPAQKKEGPEEVIVRDMTWQDRLFSETARALWLTTLTLILCYFFLVGGDALTRNIASMPRSRRRRVRILRLIRSVREHLASYLAVTLLVNLSYGTAIGLILFFMDIEFAAFWGLGAAFLRYIPFIGTIITLTLVTLATIAAHDSITTILAVPASILVLQFITGNFVDPMVHAHKFQLNPIVIFIFIIFWSWIWGLPGLFIAVPTLVVLAVICGRVEHLSRIYLIICSDPKGANK